MASYEWILLSKTTINEIIQNGVKEWQFNQITKRLSSVKLSATATTEWLEYVTRIEKKYLIKTVAFYTTLNKSLGKKLRSILLKSYNSGLLVVVSFNFFIVTNSSNVLYPLYLQRSLEDPHVYLLKLCHHLWNICPAK